MSKDQPVSGAASEQGRGGFQPKMKIKVFDVEFEVYNVGLGLAAIIAILLTSAVYFWKPEETLKIGLALGLLVSILAWQHWMRPSRLAKPEALGKVGDYFLGREDDIENLCRVIREHPLVWLLGESGVGKSTLLRKGVLPQLQEDASWLPVYLEYWGADWEADPRGALARKVFHSLGEEEREKLGLDSPSADTITGLLESVRSRLGRRPAVLFDQFDDYLTRHWDRFMPGQKGQVISAAQLLRKNAFWKEVGKLAQAGCIHCLFTTRPEMQWGLSCVRFREEALFYLQGLQHGMATALLDQVTSGNVISHPDRGWQQLKLRICRDLESEGLVLPIQMKVVIQSLPTLKHLTARAYQSKGRLVGLEASHLGSHSAAVARMTGWEPTDVRSLLLRMVEREAGRTVAQTEQQLLDSLPEKIHSLDKLRVAMEYLQRKEIVRTRLEEGEASHVWQLDHDYLCRAVLELERRTSRAQHLLEDSAQGFQAASGLWASWKNLLSPWSQLRLVFQRIRGRVRYGSHARYALLSTARFFLNVWVLAGALGLYNWHDIKTQNRADRLFSFIGQERAMAEPEANALWEISTSPEAVRIKVLHKVFSSPSESKRFSRRNSRVIHSVVGLSQRTRGRVLASVVSPECYAQTPTDPALLKSCIHLVLALEVRPAHTSAFFQSAIELLEDRPRLFDLGSDLGSMRDKLDLASTAQGAEKLVAAMQREAASYRVSSLGRALGSLRNKLDSRIAARGAEKLVATIEREEHRWRLPELGRALGPLAEKLDPTSAAKLAERLVAGMEREEDRWRLSELAGATGPLADKLDPSSAAKLAERLVAGMEREGDSSRLSELGRALEPLGEKLDPAAAAKLAERLAAAMDRESKSARLASLGRALGALGDKLDRASAAKGVERLVEAMERERSSLLLAYLGSALGSLGDKLDPASAAKGAELLMAAMERKEAPLLGLGLGSALGSLGDRLDPASAAKLAERLVAAIEREENRSRLSELGTAFGVLGSRPHPGSAAKLAVRLAAAMTRQENPDRLPVLGRALGSLGDKLEPASAAKGAQRLVAAMEREWDRSRLSELGGALESLGDKMEPGSAAELAARLLAALEQQENYGRLPEFGRALGTLGACLDLADGELLRVWFERMRKLPNPPCSAMASIARRETLQTVIDVLKWPTCTDSDRDALIHRFAELAEVPAITFGSTDKDGNFNADLWAFVDWAEEQGYDLSSEEDSWLPDWLDP